MVTYTPLQKARVVVSLYTDKKELADNDHYLSFYKIGPKDYLAAAILMLYYKHDMEKAVPLCEKIVTLYAENFRPKLQENLRLLNIAIGENSSLPSKAIVVCFLAKMQQMVLRSENDLEKATEDMAHQLFEQDPETRHEKNS